MAELPMQLARSHWEQIQLQLPASKVAPTLDGGGASDRACFEAILWLLWNGCDWPDLPAHRPSAEACRRRLSGWLKGDIWEKAFAEYVRGLDDAGQAKWAEAFVRTSFALMGAGEASRGPAVAMREQRWRWRALRVFQSEARRAGPLPRGRRKAPQKSSVAA